MIKITLVIIISFVLSFYLLLYYFQENILFHPQKLAADYKFQLTQPFEDKFLLTNSGQKINYLIFSQPNAIANILYFHGNAGSLADWGFVAQDISLHCHANVWILDYPGFGKSQGPLPTDSDQMYEIGELFLQQLTATKSNLPLVIYGRSIGTGLASQLSAKFNTANAVAATILESPYFSVEELASKLMPWAPSFLLKFKFNNLVLLNSKSKKLIFHGTKDEVIPFSQGKKLAAALGPDAHFVAIENGYHNDLANNPKYWVELEDFINQLK